MLTDLYDSADQVRVQRMISAGAITIAAYQVRDPATDRFGSLQFHMSCEEAAISSMSENAAQLFVQFVQETLSEKPGDE
ncbi:hypothetical protein [Microvirga flavescens]|uniref:hypothetical protein n=1 Tax=Microvirga flavescens TaxID=2249811 RepID=UPI000DD58918|nr:hypothetical protein [Microvirga flavescens]